MVKADPIFDAYLQRSDDGDSNCSTNWPETDSLLGLQPLRQRQDVREKIIDLAATEEDHGDVLPLLDKSSQNHHEISDRKRKGCYDAGGKAEGSIAVDSKIQWTFGEIA